MRIGIIDLDTSHPHRWVPIERELGHNVVGVWDGGSVHPDGYAESFVKKFNIPHVFASIEEMVTEVDCAVIHSANWDTHVGKARPFVEAGKSVLFDKPVVGNLGDLNQLKHWAEEGVRITGGSALRLCAETQDWLSLPILERGIPQTVLCGCSVDEFNYGIHAYAMLFGIMGGGVHSVKHLGMAIQRRILVKWTDGRCGLLIVGANANDNFPFFSTIVTERSCIQFQADSTKLYRSFLESTLPFLAGKTDHPPVAVNEWLEPELCALAARKSWLNGDIEVKVDELTLEDQGYDGKVFVEEYRKAKYP